MLRDRKVAEFDILAIQEPWRNPFSATTHHPANDIFHLCYPRDESAGLPARVCFFVNRRLDHQEWQFTAHTRDACTLTIRRQDDDETRTHLVIHNIYNPPRGANEQDSTIPLVYKLLEEYAASDQMALGDFNLHHHMWGGRSVRQADREAEELLLVMEDCNMVNTLPPGMVTYEEGSAQTTIDLCWVSMGLADRIIRSGVDRELDHDSDHLPITTILDLRIGRLTRKPGRNWRQLDQARFCKALAPLLPPVQRPRTKQAVDSYVETLVNALRSAADQTLPEIRPSNRAREGWTEECTRVLSETKRLRRRHSRYHTEDTWEAYRAARNQKTRTIRKALKKAHREKVEKAAKSPEALWKLAKWARSRDQQAPSITPSIKDPQTRREAVEVGEKAELFRQTFFPTPPPADLEDIRTAQYDDPIELPPITKKEVLEAIAATKALKAPGPDGIPNRVLQASAELLAQHLTNLFNQCLAKAYCPKHFRASSTIVLRKPGKDDYTSPKAYRPIALLNTIGKIMDAVIARRLSYVVETYQTLPGAHFGGRKQRSTEHALHNIVESIYEAWNTGCGKVASLLLLDVSGAFDNVSHERLLHDLRKRRVDERIVRWLASFLDERITRIVLDGHESEAYTIRTGIPQGSPLSPILYIFYNAGLIDGCHAEGITVTGYIDDAAILATGNSTAETCDKLAAALEKAQQWATTHASRFAPEKFQLTHFTRARTTMNLDQQITTSWCSIAPSRTCKYLGVIMDTKLKWQAHIEDIRRKVTKTVNALSSLGNSSWGVGLQEMRKLYTGVAIPQMMYACSVWSHARSNGHPYTQATLRTLQSLQARAARVISGAYKATSHVALDVETHLMPIAQRIEQCNKESLSRLLTSNGAASLIRGEERRRKHVSPLQSNFRGAARQGLITNDISEIIPAFVAPPWHQGPRTFIETSTEARLIHGSIASSTRNICIYTDGSCINDQVGAAAVCLTSQNTLKAYMGPRTTSTVYAAELQGISLALEIALKQTIGIARKQHIAIFTDNQAAIRSLTRAEGRSGAYILKHMVKQIQALQEAGYDIAVRWIPAHVGIEGNEAADIAAKEASGWRAEGSPGTRADPPDQLYTLRSTIKTQVKQRTEEQWRRAWENETKGRASHRYTPRPTKRVLLLHKGLSKKESSLLVQMRTEKIGLKDFLFSRNVPGIPDRNCECLEGRQTVHHLLLTCRNHQDIRREIFGDLPGGTNLRAVLNEHKLAIKAIRFMEQTQILGRNRIDAVE